MPKIDRALTEASDRLRSEAGRLCDLAHDLYFQSAAMREEADRLNEAAKLERRAALRQLGKQDAPVA